MLSKIRNYGSGNTVRTTYYGIFSSLMMYGSLVWGQFTNKNVARVTKLQDKAIRIINFANYTDSRNSLYKNSKILNTRSAAQYQISLPKVRTQIYGLRIVSYNSIRIWNTFVKKFEEYELHNKTRLFGKKLINKHLLDSY